MVEESLQVSSCARRALGPKPLLNGARDQGSFAHLLVGFIESRFNRIFRHELAAQLFPKSPSAYGLELQTCGGIVARQLPIVHIAEFMQPREDAFDDRIRSRRLLQKLRAQLGFAPRLAREESKGSLYEPLIERDIHGGEIIVLFRGPRQ